MEGIDSFLHNLYKKLYGEEERILKLSLRLISNFLPEIKKNLKEESKEWINNFLNIAEDICKRTAPVLRTYEEINEAFGEQFQSKQILEIDKALKQIEEGVKTIKDLKSHSPLQ